MSRVFPEDFVFGAATAAYQIEGATGADGRSDSIWDAFARIPGAVLGGDDGSAACDHYHRYRDDVALMRDLGLQAYRFSTSWCRIRPDGRGTNPAGLAFYDRLVDELLLAGISPWLTLYHWDLPQALQAEGGWLSRDTAHRFVDYALDVHRLLGDRVDVWSTLNEPWCAAFLGYCAGSHAPGIQDPVAGTIAAHHLLLAHGLAVQALRAEGASNLGIALNQTLADPLNPEDPADAAIARKIDGQYNRWFLDPIFRGSYPADIRTVIGSPALDAAVHDGDLATIAAPIDLLGVNYYQGDLVSARPPTRPAPADQAPTERPTRSPFPDSDGIHLVERGLPRTGMGWEVQPEGLTRTLLRLQREYAGPAGVRLAVTENGAAYDDEPVQRDGELRVPDAGRREFLRLHLDAALDAIDAGVPLSGFFAWSLLDNYEWAWGYGQRFGIVRVDYETLRRTVKDSGREYARIIAARRL